MSAIDDLIRNLPAGLDRAVLRVLSFHVGRGQAISRQDLLADLHQLGFRVHERAARAQISQLRKAGHLICSAGGVNGGYWLGDDRAEVEEFINTEITPRIADLAETRSALQAAVREKWGEATQPSLFG
jgi:DNA-binding transcriptional regulator PaaX